MNVSERVQITAMSATVRQCSPRIATNATPAATHAASGRVPAAASRAGSNWVSSFTFDELSRVGG